MDQDDLNAKRAIPGGEDLPRSRWTPLTMTVALIVAAGAGAGIILVWPSLADLREQLSAPERSGAVVADVIAEQADAAPPAGPAVPPQPASEVAGTPFAVHSRQAGIASCTNLYSVLGESLVSGSRYNLRSAWDDKAPNEGSIEGLVGMSYDTDAYSGTAAGYVVASPGPSSCMGAIVRIAPFPKPCEELSAVIPANSQQVEGFEVLKVYAQADRGHVMMLPVGSGCAVISTLASRDKMPEQGARQ